MKKILIVCDIYKADKFRERFIEKGYNVTGDNLRLGMHQFTIECNVNTIEQVRRDLSKTLNQLEIEIKKSN